MIYGIIYLAGVNMYARVLMDLKTTQIEPFYDYIIPSDLKGFFKSGDARYCAIWQSNQSGYYC